MKAKTHLLSALAVNFYLASLLIKLLISFHHYTGNVIYDYELQPGTFGLIQGFAVSTVTLISVMSVERYGHSKLFVNDRIIIRRNKLHSFCLGGAFVLIGAIVVYIIVRIMMLGDLPDSISNYNAGDWLESSLKTNGEIIMLAILAVSAHVVHMIEDAVTEHGIYIFDFRKRRFRRWTLTDNTYSYDSPALNGLIMAVSAVLIAAGLFAGELIVGFWANKYYDTDMLWDTYNAYYLTFVFFSALYMLAGQPYQTGQTG